MSDCDALQALLAALAAPDARRAAAEKTLAATAEQSPARFVACCVQLAAQPARPTQARLSCLLLLKRLLTTRAGPVELFHRLSPAEQQQLRRDLFLLLGSCEELAVGRQVADLIGELLYMIVVEGGQASAQQAWPGFASEVEALLGGGAHAVVLALRIYSPLSDECVFLLPELLGQVARLCEAVNSYGREEERRLAGESAADLLRFCKSRHLKQLAAVKKQFLVLLGNLMRAEETELLHLMVGKLVEAVEEKPRLFLPEVEELLSQFAAFSRRDEHKQLVSQMAHAVFLMMDEDEQLLESDRRADCFFRLLLVELQPDDPAADWGDSTEEPSDKAGEVHADRFFSLLSAACLARLALESIELVRRDDGKLCCSALLVLAQIPSHLAPESPLVEQIVAAVERKAASASALVRYHCCTLLGLFALELKSTFGGFSDRFFDALFAVIAAGPARVRGQAFCAVANFAEFAEEETLRPRLAQLFRLVEFWWNDKSAFVRESAVSVCSALMVSLQDALRPHIASVVSICLSVLDEPLADSLSELKARAAEAVSLAVARQAEATDAAALLSRLLGLVERMLEREESAGVFDCLFAAVKRIIRAVGPAVAAPERVLLLCRAVVLYYFRIPSDYSRRKFEKCLASLVQLLSLALLVWPDSAETAEQLLSGPVKQLVEFSDGAELALTATAFLCQLTRAFFSSRHADVSRTDELIELIWRLVGLYMGDGSCLGFVRLLRQAAAEPLLDEARLGDLYVHCKQAIRQSIELQAREDLALDSDEDSVYSFGSGADSLSDDSGNLEDLVSQTNSLNDLQKELGKLVGQLFLAGGAKSLALLEPVLAEIVKPSFENDNGVLIGCGIVSDALVGLNGLVEPALLAELLDLFAGCLKKPQVPIKANCVSVVGELSLLMNSADAGLFVQPRKAAADLLLSEGLSPELKEKTASALIKLTRKTWPLLTGGEVEQCMALWLGCLPFANPRENSLSLRFLLNILSERPAAVFDSQESKLPFVLSLLATVVEHEEVSSAEINGEIEAVLRKLLESESVREKAGKAAREVSVVAKLLARLRFN